MTDPEPTLSDTIEMLRPFGPSILLLRCLILVGRVDEARVMSRQLAPLEAARLAVHKKDPLASTSELRLRNIFCQEVAGSARNARLILTQFIHEAEELAWRTPKIIQDFGSQLAIGAIFVNDSALTARAIQLVDKQDSLATRMLRAWKADESGELRMCADELRKYTQNANLPIWSDTWHHLLLSILSGAINFHILKSSE